MNEGLKIRTDYELVSISGEAALPIPDSKEFKWIAAAREGQVIALEGGLGVITREALESSLGTWNGKVIKDNHKTIKAGFSIHGEKFISPFLYFLLDNVTVGELEKGGGGSIDALALKIEDNKVLGMSGIGYSVLSPGLMPSCTKESGCGIPIKGEVKKPPELEQDSNSKSKNIGGSKQKMADKETGVVYSADQVADIKAAAVAEVTEQLGNAHKVEVGQMEAARAAELKALDATHTVALATEHETAYKQAGVIESLAMQYSLSDEVKKELIAAKTPEDAFAVFAGLTVTKPVAGEGAAESKDKKGGGIIEGAAKIEAKAPEMIKTEEVGNWDPYTQKFVPSYREEPI